MRNQIILCLLLSPLACKTRGPETTSATLAATGSKLAPAAPRNLDRYQCPDTPKVKVAFFDADSTLRVAKNYTVSANGPKDVNILPFVGPKLGELKAQGYLIAIVSNQGGITSTPPAIKEEVAAGALMHTAGQIALLGGRVDFVTYAPGKDSLRKPDIGMAQQVIDAVKAKCQKDVDLEASLMVGDSGYLRGSDGPHPDGRPADDFSNADRGFAEKLFKGLPNAPNQFFEPTDYFGWKAFRVYNIENAGELEDFYLTIEAQGNKAQKAEVARLRKVNEMPNRSVRFAHFNIKELRTDKITNQNDAQVTRALQNLRELNPDIVSINEIQYDLPNVPTQGLPGTGDNMRRLLERAKFPGGVSGWSFNLAPANTGKRAKKKANGNYEIDPNSPDGRKNADQVSFGTFPGQYSTGFGTRFKVKGKVVVTDTLWKEWDPNFLSLGLKLPDGTAAPEDMELFDKNFNDVVIDLDGHDVHVVTFHTVPAFGFGGSATLNIARNAAQLSFLKWYLLGECDNGACKASGVEPLPAGTAFIAIGDLNVDWGTDSPGAKVIESLLKHERVNNFRAENKDWKFKLEPLEPGKKETDRRARVTYMSDGVDLGKLQSELDYFIVSKELKIDSGRVYAPLSYFEQHGSCSPTKTVADQAAAQVKPDPNREVSVSTRFIDADGDGQSESREFCAISVTKEFAAFRKGSDHFPVYISFHWVGATANETSP